MNLDTGLWIAGSVAQATVVGLLVYRRVWRTLPVFCIFSSWALIAAIGGYAIERRFPGAYLDTYLAVTAVDSTLELAVLIELAWSVLRPVHVSLPRGSLVGIALLILGLGALIWPFAALPDFGDMPAKLYFLMHLQQTTSLLRIVAFLALAAFGQFLSINWRDREFQVASGLGFYSFVALAVALLHSHLTTGSQYTHLSQVLVGGYICSLSYWIVCFAQKDAERREFTPQMEHLLLAVARNAHSTQVALSESVTVRQRKRHN